MSSSSSSSLSECSSLGLFETMATCTDGILSVYRRSVDILIGDWYFFERQGCCTGGGGSSSGGGTVETTCCGEGIPDTLTIIFSDGTGDCTCLNGATTTLTWTGFHNPEVWSGNLTACEFSVGISLGCTNNVWNLVMTGCGGGGSTPGTGTGGCLPFNIVINASITNCCTGNVVATITS